MEKGLLDETIQIQVKRLQKYDLPNYSRSFSVKGESVDTVFNRVKFLFQQLEASEEKEVRIVHHKRSGRGWVKVQNADS